MSQSDLAEILNIKHPVISRWIKGHSNNPKMETMEKIANALNIPVSYFLNDENNLIQPKEINIKDDKNNDVLNLILKLMEEQNKKFEEKDKRFESNMEILKKEIELIKKEIEILKNKF